MTAAARARLLQRVEEIVYGLDGSRRKRAKQARRRDYEDEIVAPLVYHLDAGDEPEMYTLAVAAAVAELSQPELVSRLAMRIVRQVRPVARLHGMSGGEVLGCYQPLRSLTASLRRYAVRSPEVIARASLRDAALMIDMLTKVRA